MLQSEFTGCSEFMKLLKLNHVVRPENYDQSRLLEVQNMNAETG